MERGYQPTPPLFVFPCPMCNETNWGPWQYEGWDEVSYCGTCGFRSKKL